MGSRSSDYWFFYSFKMSDCLQFMKLFLATYSHWSRSLASASTIGVFTLIKLGMGIQLYIMKRTCRLPNPLIEPLQSFTNYTSISTSFSIWTALKSCPQPAHITIIFPCTSQPVWLQSPLELLQKIGSPTSKPVPPVHTFLRAYVIPQRERRYLSLHLFYI